MNFTFEESHKQMEELANKYPQYKSSLSEYSIKVKAVRDFSIRGSKLIIAGDETFAKYDFRLEGDLNGAWSYWSPQNKEYFRAKTRAFTK